MIFSTCDNIDEGVTGGRSGVCLMYTRRRGRRDGGNGGGKLRTLRNKPVSKLLKKD